MAKNDSIAPKPDDPYANSIWNQFLLDDGSERVVFTGLITKKKSFFTRKRQLILTSLPRFIYVDPETMEFRKDIPWDEIKSEIVDDSTFTIQTPHRTYVMKGLSTSSHVWVEEIRKMGEIVEKQQTESLKEQVSRPSNPMR